MRLFLFIFFIVFTFQGLSQAWPDGHFIGTSATCNGASDGYAEFDIYSVYFYGSGYVGYPPTVIVSSFLWFNGNTTSSLYNLSSGNYNLTISLNFEPVYYLIEVWIDEPPPIQIQSSQINPDCDTCAMGSISISVYGGNNPYSYNWSTGATTLGLTNLLYGSYHLTIIDDNGCEANEEFFLMFNPPDTQEIALNAGWNMFSTYKSFENPPLDTLLSSIQGNYSIVKNWDGEVYWPQYSVNTFDSVDMEYGFQIKMTNTDTLKLTGPTIIPENHVIFLPLGWSTIGYPRYVDGPISELMSYQINHILIMKDDIGQVWWPQYGVDLIQTMHPGEAYQIKIDTWMNFTYPSYLENH